MYLYIHVYVTKLFACVCLYAGIGGLPMLSHVYTCMCVSPPIGSYVTNLCVHMYVRICIRKL